VKQGVGKRSKYLAAFKMNNSPNGDKVGGFLDERKEEKKKEKKKKKKGKKAPKIPLALMVQFV
jgi:hypothetical protein